MDLPKDPIILLSYVNTRLRDEFSSLDDLCAGLDVVKEDLVNELAKINYTYDEKRNAFV